MFAPLTGCFEAEEITREDYSACQLQRISFYCNKHDRDRMKYGNGAMVADYYEPGAMKEPV